MIVNPELEEFRRQIDALRKHPVIRAHIREDVANLRQLSLEAIDDLLRNKTAYYFLIAAADLNRTTLKKAIQDPAAQIVTPRQRRAHVIKGRIPVRLSFATIAAKAVGLRAADFGRMGRGEVERLFRERLRAEGIPILMSPPLRSVPGLLIPERKLDGIFPDPRDGKAPKVYLEIKNVQRVSDDIQKRLYELAEVSLEMKCIYGPLTLRGLALSSTLEVKSNPVLRKAIRDQIVRTPPGCRSSVSVSEGSRRKVPGRGGNLCRSDLLSGGDR